ncbi:MAG: pre-peptidase C-terminal domain-containing protein [Deltaproteobacteria bacterium]
MSRRALGLAALIGLLFGCPTPEYVYPPGTPAILRLDVVPNVFDPGQDVVVRWSVQGSDTVQLTLGDAATAAVAAEGEMSFTPSASGDVELVATSAGGERRARVAYTVRNPSPVQVLRFLAEPQLVRPGEPVTLRWETQNATRIRIRSSDGESYYDGSDASSALTIRPTRSVQITLTAEGFGGPVVSALSISTEEGLPFIYNFSADPPVISSRDTPRVAWLTGRATSVELSERIDDAWVVLHNEPASLQTVWYALDSTPGTRRFRLEARNASGSSFAEATAVVVETREPIIQTFTATPTVNGFGGTVRLDWGAVGASDVRIDAAGQQIAGNLPLYGGRSLMVFDDVELVLVARDDFGAQTSSTVAIDLDESRPRIQQFLVNPTHVVNGEPVQLRHFVNDADSVEVRTEDGVDIPLDPSGLTTWVPDQTTILTLRARNAFGQTVIERRVSVGAIPVIEQFTVDELVVRNGRETEARWRTQNAISTRLFLRGFANPVDPDSGSTRIFLSSPEPLPLELQVTGAGGYVVTATVTVDGLDAVQGAGVEVEPNDRPPTAHVLDPTASPTVTGSVAASDEDWFFVGTGFGRRIQSFDTAPTSGQCPGLRVSFFIDDETGDALGPLGVFGGPGVCPAATVHELSLLADLPLAFLVRIDRPPGALASTSSYAFTLTTGISQCSDTVLDRAETCDDGNVQPNDGCDNECHDESSDEQEPNFTTTIADPLVVATPLFGRLAPDDVDVFSFEVEPNQGGPVWVTLTSPTGACGVDASLELFNDFGQLLLRRENVNGCATLDGPFAVLPEGRYFVQVQAGLGAVYPARGSYRLTLQR